MKQIEVFISENTKNAKILLLEKIMGNPTLSSEQDALLDAAIPIIQNYLMEIHEKLDNNDITKKELSELYFQESALRSDLQHRLEVSLSRDLQESEFIFIQQVIELLEQISVEAWFEY